MTVAGAGTSEDLSATALRPSVERHKSRIIPTSSRVTFNCNKKFSLGLSSLNDLSVAYSGRVVGTIGRG